MTPDQAYNLTVPEQAVQHAHLKNNAAKSYKEIDTVLKVGDKVRIVIEKSLIKKKMLPTWSEEIYTVKTVIPGNKAAFTISRYKLVDSEGLLQRNTYQLSKLLLIPPN